MGLIVLTDLGLTMPSRATLTNNLWTKMVSLLKWKRMRGCLPGDSWPSSMYHGVNQE